MTDDVVDALRHLDRSQYPGRGDRLDPVLVVHAGRRRVRVRRVAGTTAACALVAALAFGLPPLVGRTDHPTLPITTPEPSSTPAASVTPSPSPSSAGYPGIVTTMPTPLSDPLATALLGTPATVGDVGGVQGSIIGPGDGTVLPVAVTPTAYDPQSDVFPSFRSGFGLWTPGGSIDWIVAPPSAPRLGPTTTEAAVSGDWIVWFESDFANSYEAPYVLWARPRSGGQAHEIARSAQSPDKDWPYAVYEHHPVIAGETLFWYDEVYEGAATVAVVMSAPLDGSRPATVLVRNARSLDPDRCSADVALFVVVGADANPQQELHRIGLGADGFVVSDLTLDGDLVGTGEDVRAVAACGDTVVVAHDIDWESVERGSWLEIRQPGAPTRSIVWPEGSGSSIGDLVAGPGFVTWYTYNGAYAGDTYLYDLTDQTLHEFTSQQAIRTDGTFVWWYQSGPESSPTGPTAARINGR